MTVDQRERRVLQEALVNALGTEPTDVLMDYLPPVGWADVATKTDLERHAAETRAELAALEKRVMIQLHKELRAQFLSLVTVMTAIMGLLFGASTAIIKLT